VPIIAQTCSYSCTKGSCQDGICECPPTYFGRRCDREIKQMSQDVFEDMVTLSQFEGFYFSEDFLNGNPDLSVEIESVDRPLMKLLINQFETETEIKFMERDPSSQFSKLYDLSLLMTGSVQKSYPIKLRYGYFTFINYRAGSSNISFRFSRMRSNLLGTITYFIYTTIMVAITILFCLIICVTCVTKIRESREENQNRVAPGEQPQINDQNIGDEQEDPNALDEDDIDKWMPIIDITEERRKKHKIYDSNCSICLELIENGELLRRIKPCKHTFHDKCLKDWLLQKESCPNCNFDLSKKALLEYEKKIWKKHGLIIPSVVKSKRLSSGSFGKAKQITNTRDSTITPNESLLRNSDLQPLRGLNDFGIANNVQRPRINSDARNEENDDLSIEEV